MTTRYTHSIEDLTKPPPGFEQFVWSCARAFDARTLQYDTTQLSESLSEYKESLRDLLESTDEQLQGKIDLEYAHLVHHWDLHQLSIKEILDRYAEMQRQIDAWDVPSAYATLKEFMTTQISNSKADLAWGKPEKLLLPQWKMDNQEHLLRLISAVQKDINSRVLAAECANNYFHGLNASVPRPHSRRVGKDEP